MPNGTLFTSQTTPNLSSAARSATPASQSAATTTAPNGASSTSVTDNSTDATTAAATELSTAIDEFQDDLDKKFRSIGDEILGKCKSCFFMSGRNGPFGPLYEARMRDQDTDRDSGRYGCPL